MAFTTIKISPTKLMGVLRSKRFSKADLMRQLGVSRESVLQWTNENKSVVGVRPDFFRKMLEVLDVDAATIEADFRGDVRAVLMSLWNRAAAAGLSAEEVIDFFWERERERVDQLKRFQEASAEVTAILGNEQIDPPMKGKPKKKISPPNRAAG